MLSSCRVSLYTSDDLTIFDWRDTTTEKKNLGSKRKGNLFFLVGGGGIVMKTPCFAARPRERWARKQKGTKWEMGHPKKMPIKKIGRTQKIVFDVPTICWVFP